MIGAQQKIVSFVHGGFPISHFSQFPTFGIYEWDEETYFWVYGTGRSVSTRPSDMMSIRIHKPEDPSAFWLDEENRVLVCDPAQSILDSLGRWRHACDLSVGDKLQHFCGNGHTAVIDSIGPTVAAIGCDFEAVSFGTFVTAGLILKARNA